MAEPEEAAQLLDQAERASADGDYAEAERYLRQALKVQEGALGLVHPEVANTLNNLGVVCDTLGRPDEAEFLYRRALGIARKTLLPGHPYIATSLENLSSLYRAQGKPEKLADVARERPQRAGLPGVRSGADEVEAEEVETADVVEPPPPVVEPSPASVEPSPPAVESPPPVVELPPPVVEPSPATVEPGGVAPTLGAQAAAWIRERWALLAGGVVLLLVVVWLASGDTEDPVTDAPPEVASPVETPPPAPPVQTATTDAPDEGAPGPVSDAPVSAVSDESDTAPPPEPEPATDADVPAGAPGASWAVAEAQLCRSLSTRGRNGAPLGEWQCESVSGSLMPGSLSFYTRVRSRTAATVEHRWFRNDRQTRQIPLSIEANDGPGYRTYSTRTISPQETGDWRVELWSADGELLHVERFVVQ